MMWDDFGVALRSVVMDFPPRTFLVISEQEHPELFVQFAGLDERSNSDKIIAELASRKNGDIFTPEQVSLLERWGFEELPEKYVRLWHRYLPWPTPSTVVADTVNACILRLRDIGGIPDPSRLQYRAWRDGEFPTPDAWWELDPGERSVSFPSLGIMQDPSDPSSW